MPQLKCKCPPRILNLCCVFECQHQYMFYRLSKLKTCTNIPIYERATRFKLGYVPQDVYLMDESMKSNIAFGVDSREIDQNLLEEVIKDAKLEKFINSYI